MIKWLSKFLWDLQVEQYHSLIVDAASRPSIYSQILVPKLISHLSHFSRGTRVLDVGCGNGYLANQLSSLGFAVDAIDSSPTLVRLAKTYYSAPHFRVLDAEHISTMKHTYEAVVANLSIHDMPDLKTVIFEIRNALKPGGLFIFSVPHPCFFLPSSQKYFHGKQKDLIIKKYKSTRRFIKTLGGKVRVYHFHHTLETYFSIPLRLGFRLISFQEIFDDDRTSAHFEVPSFILLSFQR